ncbi:MAG: thioredoxin-dependent thiol peroxidase [Cytophagales bacterium]|nr:thioredoxin-dependent thiol peroxidase [Cytophagales bacterium]
MRPKVGDKAPNFKARIQTGQEIQLEDYLGKKVLLYFYPKDQTPGCTKQACHLRDHYEKLKEKNYVVLGVSKDSESSHQRFIEKESLPFDLIADTDKSLHESYGTWVEKKNYGKAYMGTDRVSFVIDEKGYIEKRIDRVKTSEHLSQIFSEEDLS